MHRVLLSSLVSAAVLVLSPAAWALEDKDVIDYRQRIMNTLGEQSGALGEALSTAIPADNLVAHLDAIALSAATALKSFEPKVQGGESKPEVWSNWADFQKRMQAFAENTVMVAQKARTGGRESIMGDIAARWLARTATTRTAPQKSKNRCLRSSFSTTRNRRSIIAPRRPSCSLVPGPKWRSVKCT